MTLRRSFFYGLFFIVVLIFRVWIGSATEYYRGYHLFKTGDAKNAIYTLGKSIRWYSPMNLWVGKSVVLLEKYAGEVKDSNPELSLLALSEIRHALYSVRSFYQPYETKLIKINQRIADLRHQIEQSEVQKNKLSLKYYQDIYFVPQMPFPWALLCFHVFFWSWIANLFFGVIYSFDEHGKLILPYFKRHLIIFFMTFVCWALSLNKVVIF